MRTDPNYCGMGPRRSHSVVGELEAGCGVCGRMTRVSSPCLRPPEPRTALPRPFFAWASQSPPRCHLEPHKNDYCGLYLHSCGRFDFCENVGSGMTMAFCLPATPTGPRSTNWHQEYQQALSLSSPPRNGVVPWACVGLFSVRRCTTRPMSLPWRGLPATYFVGQKGEKLVEVYFSLPYIARTFWLSQSRLSFCLPIVWGQEIEIWVPYFSALELFYGPPPKRGEQVDATVQCEALKNGT